MELITALQAFNSEEAQIARARLEAAGFRRFVTHEPSPLSLQGYSVAAGGIPAQVPEAEAAEAKESI